MLAGHNGIRLARGRGPVTGGLPPPRELTPVLSFADARILVVDDQPANVRLMERLLEKLGYSRIRCTTEPTEVFEICRSFEPDLVLLDLQMPNLDGFQVLEQLRPWMEGEIPLPVVVITADTAPQSCERALGSGASDFLTKPFNHREVELRVGNLLDRRHSRMELKRYSESLEERIHERTSALEAAKLDVLDRLALAGEYRDDGTQEHAQRVGRTAALLAAQLGLSQRHIALLRRAATLHDIGKIGIPDAILLKPGHLTEIEYGEVKQHTRIGNQILTGSGSELLQTASEIALLHHERWDGAGYPYGLAGQEIPINARIVAVADVFDVLTHDRPYRSAVSAQDAVAEIVRCSGSQFDPAVVRAFVTLDHASLLTRIARA